MSKDGFLGNLNAQQESALNQLATKLCDEAGTAGLQGQDLIIWGVTMSGLHLKSGQPDRKQSVVLLKFLRARKFNVEQALSMAIKCLKWRKEFGTSKLMDEKFPDSLVNGGMIYGRDAQGCPVTYNLYGKMNLAELLQKEGAVETFVRWRVQLQEQAIALLDFENGVENVLQIHDYSGASMRLDPKIKQASKQIIALFQDNYPEMLSTKLFLHVPRVMEFLFNIMSSFSDANTRKKFRMVGPGNSRAVLLEYIRPEQLPPSYGGFENAADAGHTQSGEITLRNGVPEEVCLEIGLGGKVAWSFMTKRDTASVKLILESPAAGGGAGTSGGGSDGRDAQTVAEMTDECGGGELEAPAGARLVVRFEGKGRGLLWKDDVQVLYAIRLP